ncbi:MAG: hypothetical protein A2Z29_06555 [Chloroflexi bacterium RBG_16_56_11]|nr:MAG: hypothetical protein A2Z29_06555 [Chloroflexi bacterium RBG_16_56_11]
MVQAIIMGKIEKEQPPAAPPEDEAKIQHLMDDLLGRIFKSPRTEVQKEILLGTLRDVRLKVNLPIRVKFSYENEQVIAEAEEINEFGFGTNSSEALVDLQRAISELYFTLEKEQKRLGMDLQKVWAVLQEKILRR